MKIYTVDYKKHYGNDGTVYRQSIKIDSELMDKYNSLLDDLYDRILEHKKENRLITNYEMDILSYTGKLEKGVNYLKLTGLSLFNNLVWDLNLENKYRIISRNTIVIVK